MRVVDSRGFDARTASTLCSPLVQQWNRWRLECPNVPIDLSGGNFDYLDLIGIDLTNARLTGASFMSAALTSASFNGAYGEQVIFSGADLRWASMCNSRFPECQLVCAFLDHAEVRNSKFPRGKFCGGSSWKHAGLSYVDFLGCNFDSATFEKAEIHGCNFVGTKTVSVCFVGALIEDCRGLTILPTSDGRGPYWPLRAMQQRDGSYLYEAGCRSYTAQQAIEHWAPLDHGQTYVDAVKGHQKQLAIEAAEAEAAALAASYGRAAGMIVPPAADNADSTAIS